MDNALAIPVDLMLQKLEELKNDAVPYFFLQAYGDSIKVWGIRSNEDWASDDCPSYDYGLVPALPESAS